MKYFYFTRPTIATALRDHGVMIERCENIYDPTRIAWRAKIDPLLCRVVVDYYTHCLGKPIPKQIEEYMKKQKEN